MGKKSKSSKPRSRKAPLPSDTEERIRQRAYRLYEQRGKVHGFAFDDWLQAESEIRREKKPDSKPKRNQSGKKNSADRD